MMLLWTLRRNDSKINDGTFKIMQRNVTEYEL